MKNFQWLCLACCALALACGDDSTPANPGGGSGQGGQGGSPAPMGREVCDGEDNDGDGNVDEGLTTRACSNACGTGQELCSQGAWRDCSAPDVFEEACDGVDNDCDNKVDEALVRPCSTACGSGQEACTGGDWNGCDAPQPLAEACDNMDNDCDGRIDEEVFRTCDLECGMGTETCTAGTFGECEGQGAAIEVCGNDADDDCDSVVDEGCACAQGDTQSCSGEIGECQAGVRVCDENGMFGDCVNPDTNEPVLEPGDRAEYDATCAIDCSAECSGIADETEKAACEAECDTRCAEPCNGKDDDCDGRVDEVMMGTPCSTDVGACMVGQLSCTDTGAQCLGGVLPRDEACDLADNDCDGVVDEDSVSVDETCDGLDNDCDSMVDEGLMDPFESPSACEQARELGEISQDVNEFQERRSQLQPAGDIDWFFLDITETFQLINLVSFRFTVEIADLEPNAGYSLCVRAISKESGLFDFFNAGIEQACAEAEEVCVTQSGNEDFLRFEREVSDVRANDDGQVVLIKVSATDANACSPYTLRYSSQDI